MKKLALLSFLIFASVGHVFAQDVEVKRSPLRLLIGAAFEFGGDEVAEVYFSNDETQSVNAGQGVSIAIGGEYQFPQMEKLLLRATVGYKYVTTQADNAHIRLTRVPFHFTANYMVAEKIRIGAGLASHQGINFKADGIGQDVKFKGATGPTFEVAYGIVGLTYTAMKYKDRSDMSYSANAVGLTLSFVLPKR